MAVGHIETFSYVFLSQLGASATLIGTTITVGSAVELVMLSVSGLCMTTIGHVTLIIMGMALYAVRLIGTERDRQPLEGSLGLGCIAA